MLQMYRYFPPGNASKIIVDFPFQFYILVKLASVDIAHASYPIIPHPEHSFHASYWFVLISKFHGSK